MMLVVMSIVALVVMSIVALVLALYYEFSDNINTKRMLKLHQYAIPILRNHDLGLYRIEGTRQWTALTGMGCGMSARKFRKHLERICNTTYIYREAELSCLKSHCEMLAGENNGLRRARLRDKGWVYE